MIKVLFICHGNICRSPMAEFVLKQKVKERGVAADFHIESAATSNEEIGNPVYPPARKKLAEHGIRCDGKTARRMRKEDYAQYDYIIGMDGIQVFYGLRGTGDFTGPSKLKDGEICAFWFADKEYCAIWRTPGSWTGDSWS